MAKVRGRAEGQKPPTRAEKTANAILEAALALMSQRGTGRMSMQDVGRAAGISRASLYRHFPTKADLLMALAAKRRLEFTERLVQAVPHGAKPAELVNALTTLLESYYEEEEPARFLEHEPEFAIATFRANIPLYIGIAVSDLGLAGGQGAIPAEIMVELLVRMMASEILIPSAPSATFLRRFHPYLRDLIGGPGAAATPSRDAG